MIYQLLVLFIFAVLSCNGQSELQAVIIHCDDKICKVGFGSEGGKPRDTLPSVVGRPKVGAKDKKIYVGKEVERSGKNLNLSYPIKNGIVQNWDDFQILLEHIFRNVLRVTSEEHPVLLSESPSNPRANRYRTTQMLFDWFHVPAMYLAKTNKLKSIDSSTHDVWVGGAKLVSKTSFQNKWITHEQYEEDGPNVIDEQVE